jgi:hypothetical protein
MQKLLGILALGFLVSSCATMQSQSSTERMERWFAKPKYVVQFDSEKSSEELIEGLRASKCQTEIAETAGAAVPDVNFKAEYGVFPDGTNWASLNSDAPMMHDSVMGVMIKPTIVGSNVMVSPVKRNEARAIKISLEAGTLFCNWRAFSDPWRM